MAIKFINNTLMKLYVQWNTWPRKQAEKNAQIPWGAHSIALMQGKWMAEMSSLLTPSSWGNTMSELVRIQCLTQESFNIMNAYVVVGFECISV